MQRTHGAPVRVSLVGLQHLTQTGWRWLVSLLCLLSVGCVPEVAHVPNARLLDTMPLSEARQRLQDVLARSINPRVTDGQITDDFVQYRYQQNVVGPWWTPVTVGMVDNRIHFLNVHKVEVYSNNLVIVRADNQVSIAQFVFGNTPDATMFADLLTSLQTRRAGRR